MGSTKSQVTNVKRFKNSGLQKSKSLLNESYQYRGSLKTFPGQQICSLNQNIIDGAGEFKWPDGRHYFGEFNNGTMNGHGKLIWNDKYGGKATYKGQFIGNLFHGYGILKWSNGDTYSGDFHNGIYQGKGEFRWADTSKHYKGEFKNGLMHGKG